MTNIKIKGTKAPNPPPSADAPPPVPMAYAMSIKIRPSFVDEIVRSLLQTIESAAAESPSTLAEHAKSAHLFSSPQAQILTERAKWTFYDFMFIDGLPRSPK
jgi:hypothetical protein